MNVPGRRVLAAPIAAFTSMLLVVVAWAAWTSGADASADSAFNSTGVEAGQTPTAVVAGPSVTVDWAASTLSNGDPVDGYEVARLDAATFAPQTVGAACAGIVAASTCVEAGVPAGTWVYAVTPVHATTWRGSQSANSNPATVAAADATAPANAITVSGLTGGAAMTGSTVYYRGLAAGSFTLTNAVSDAGSGPASSQTGALGNTPTNWTHTPSTVSTPAGGPYVSDVFSWTAGATSSPTVVVTGRDVAGNASPVTLTFVNDSTAPSAGTVSSPAGYQPGLSVPVTFTTGTDAGSGIATRQLQRRTAPLTPADTCVAWTGYTAFGPANPTSVHTDTTVINGICYQYQYVVTDRVGNTHTVSSATVSIVDYAGAVNTTPSALSHWRLGETTTGGVVASDTMTGADGALLSAHTSDSGDPWTYIAGGDNEVIFSNRITSTDGARAIYYNAATPTSTDYSVEADLYVKGILPGDMSGVVGRASGTGTPIFYMGRYEEFDGSWNIVKYSGASTDHMVWDTGNTLTVGQTYTVRLEMSGTSTTTLRLFVNDVLTLTTSDSTAPITIVGKGGFMEGEAAANGVVKGTGTGIHLDNFQIIDDSANPPAADSKGTNHGAYVNGTTGPVAGALSGDADTAALFDGVNDYVQVSSPTGLPTGAGVRSVEAWFKTSSAARQVLFSYGSRSNTAAFGLLIDHGGDTMIVWGFGASNDKTFTMPAPVDDGQWHHVVKTFNGSAVTLYIDGQALTPQAVTRNTVIDAYGFGIGAVIHPSDTYHDDYFNGSIDEVSFYTSALSQATVTNHHQLGTSVSSDVTGPTGGSVDANGLVGTGSRYATSTTLSLNLAKGSDPAGVAATGATLSRASGTLASTGTADGVCSAFGSYALVSGGTDPASPKTDTVSDQACYRYQYLVHDELGYPTTYTSGDIKVDLSAPAAPSLSFGAFTNTYWSTGGTVYYRWAAGSGSFTATSTASDARSGVASHAFPALGTNWISTPGALGVNTYSWSGPPQAPGAKTMTATNHATRVSGTTTFTPTADDTAPSAGTVTYPNATQASTTISVGYTTGTDAGSGIASRLLQRQSATLTGTTCGSYGGYATIAGGTNPAASPVADLVASGRCYQYRYVVTDRVGNVHIATSTNVVKVTGGTAYYDAVSASGPLNYYRLAETWGGGGATIASDDFAGTATTLLTADAGGATWAYLQGSGNAVKISTQGRAYRDGFGYAVNYATETPASPDYSVEADLHVKSFNTNDAGGVVGRLNSLTHTFYMARWETDNTWDIVKWDGSSPSWLDTSSVQPNLVAGTTYNVRLEISGTSTTTLNLYVNDVLMCTATDSSSPLTGAGRAGIMDGDESGAFSKADGTGFHFDNFLATTLVGPVVTDSRPALNHGTYLNGVTLGEAGALSETANTAILFDGSNDYVRTPSQSLSSFSIEFWFKSTQGISTSSDWWDAAALVDSTTDNTANDWGTSLRSDGRIMAGVGNPNTTIVSATGGYDDGAWHHVVFTRSSSSGAMLLYIDGSSANGGSATGATGARHNFDITFGREAEDLSHAYLGHLDEVAIYGSVLSGATVTTHFSAR